MPAYTLLYPAGGGQQTIATQSTAVALSTTSKPCVKVIINGASSNTSAIVAADSTARLLAASRVGIPVYWGSTSHPVTIECFDVSQVYIDGISTEQVSYTYFRYGAPS